ncbi:DUF4912 domain-containing protein [Brevibacillus sp. SYSU BS000544]|uniref:DUF4912 domain-containing protein n=1 Tax=Brevibacillus sp. SYSU BS000544 TaxID=3416443 RepID=UPI003CE50D83
MNTNPERSSTDVEDPNIRIEWKDDQSLRATWSMTESFRLEAEREFGIPFSELPFILRLYDLTGRGDIKNDGTDSYTDFDINHRSSEWILYGVMEGLTYCVDLGVRMIDGRFYSLSRSAALA